MALRHANLPGGPPFRIGNRTSARCNSVMMRPGQSFRREGGHSLSSLLQRTVPVPLVRCHGSMVRSLPVRPPWVPPAIVMSALADVDGDGVRECVLSENNGRILIVRANGGAPSSGATRTDGGIRAVWSAGFRLQLEGFSAARPGPVPVVYRPRPEQLPVIVVPDNTNTLHQLQAAQSGRYSRRTLEETRARLDGVRLFVPQCLCARRGRGW